MLPAEPRQDALPGRRRRDPGKPSGHQPSRPALLGRATERFGEGSVHTGDKRGYSRVGTLPVAGAVLDAATRGVSPGSPRSSGREAAPVSASAPHPAHGAARAARTPGATGSPRACKEGSVNPKGNSAGAGGWGAARPRAGLGLGLTSAERGGHSPLLPGGHPAPHAVHRALLARQGHLELAALEILPWEEHGSESFGLGRVCTAGGWPMTVPPR